MCEPSGCGAGGRAPRVESRIEGVGVRALDRRRVDVAVDLAPVGKGLDLEMVIVGPGGDEVCWVRLVHSRETAVDKIMHLRKDAEPGAHTLHVGLFDGDRLLDRAERQFTFPPIPAMNGAQVDGV